MIHKYTHVLHGIAIFEWVTIYPYRMYVGLKCSRFRLINELRQLELFNVYTLTRVYPTTRRNTINMGSFGSHTSSTPGNGRHCSASVVHSTDAWV